MIPQGRKEWILKNKYLLILIVILLFAFIIRVQYLNTNQAVWWDAADYLMSAKEIGGVTNLETYDLNPKRPFLLPLIWGIMYRLGGNETLFNLSEIILSWLTVLFTYLIAKEFFNEKIALIATFMMSVLWMPIFFTHRLMTDVPALAFWLMTFYYFWKGYIKEEGKKYLYYSMAFLALSIFTRAASLINIIPIAIMMLIKQRLSLFKDKKFWISLLIFLLVLSPFIIWIFASYDNPLYEFTKSRGYKGELYNLSNLSNLWNNLSYITATLLTPYLSNILTPNLMGFIILLLVLFLSLDALIGLDLVIKNKDQDLMKKLFILISILTPYLFYSLFNPGIEDRYLMGMYPFMFILFGVGLVKLKDFLARYNKILSVIFIIVLLFIFGFVNFKTTDMTIKSKADSYAPVALAGKWIYENSYKMDKVISASKFQNMYYSERETYPFPKNEEEFASYLESVKPKYIVVSVFEPGFTPQWVYSYFDKYKDMFRPVQAYTATNNQALLVIYEYLPRNEAVA